MVNQNGIPITTGNLFMIDKKTGTLTLWYDISHDFKFHLTKQGRLRVNTYKGELKEG